MALSHFVYSAPLLASCDSIIKSQLDSYQRRILRILHITPEEAKTKYNLVEISELIDKHCTLILKRILTDDSHPLTTKISKVESKAKFKFVISKYRTKEYANSFVQKYLRIIRDGSTGLYTTGNNGEKINNTTLLRRTQLITPTLITTAKKPKPTDACVVCGLSIARSGAMTSHLKKHQRQFKLKSLSTS